MKGLKIVNPLSYKGTLEPISTVLRALAGQENCDDEPYNQLMVAADYIDALEYKISWYEERIKDFKQEMKKEK